MKALNKISDMFKFENYIYDENLIFSPNKTERNNAKKLYMLAKRETKNKLIDIFKNLKFNISNYHFVGSSFTSKYRNKQIRISLGHKYSTIILGKIGQPSITIKNINTNRFLFKKYFIDCADMFTNIDIYKQEIRKALIYNEEFIHE